LTLTIDRVAQQYFVLYEGSPGGLLDSKDYWVTSDGVPQSIEGNWAGDLPDPEWVYFADGAADRSLFMAHHGPDTTKDVYWNGEGQMTVFGFGRTTNLGDPGFIDVPRRISVGLVESRKFETVEATINAAYELNP
jgi:hypothetical protein